MLINYSVLLDLGFFLEKDYNRNVLEEKLEIDDKLLFERKNNELKFENLKSFEDYIIPEFKKGYRTLLSILQTSLKNDDLFLMNGFRTIVSSNLAEFIADYFTNY